MAWIAIGIFIFWVVLIVGGFALDRLIGSEGRVRALYFKQGRDPDKEDG